MATSRPTPVSRARETSPIPPAPMAERISYGPKRTPGRKDNGLRWLDYTLEVGEYAPCMSATSAAARHSR
jgi:hypothetical protein